MFNQELIGPLEFNDLIEYETTRFTNDKDCYDDSLEFESTKNVEKNIPKFTLIFNEEEKTKNHLLDNNDSKEEGIKTDFIKEIIPNFVNDNKKISKKSFISTKRKREKDKSENEDEDKEELPLKSNKGKSIEINSKKVLNHKEQNNIISKGINRIKNKILPNLSQIPQKQAISTSFPPLFEKGNILTKKKDEYNEFHPNNFNPFQMLQTGQFNNTPNINKVNNNHTKNLNLNKKKTSFLEIEQYKKNLNFDFNKKKCIK